ncbi:hypothetical protein KIN20_005956 [Parelaphostrongylus tenuis]|uniref:Uncharacterized protein n=1 Tax=Parelaphostrongylus tenuis TaxID=148309 RepID=A0AAD5QFJ1_PARTN|nr:hypothetical protein KIN20_005956 [Parelaphostrongylus tenuis]
MMETARCRCDAVVVLFYNRSPSLNSEFASPSRGLRCHVKAAVVLSCGDCDDIGTMPLRRRGGVVLQ